MRIVLKFLEGKRLRFEGVVQRTGTRSSYKGSELQTILLKNIKIADRTTVICDHIWLTKRKRLEEVNAGDIIQFDARIGTYYKGYKGRRIDVNDKPIELDYRFERPSEVIKIGTMDIEEIPEIKIVFSANYDLLKSTEKPKDDWSDFFLSEVKFYKKIKEVDLKRPMDIIVYNNLLLNEDLPFIENRINDFKRWVKHHNNQFIEEPIDSESTVKTTIIQSVKESRWFVHFQKWTTEKLAIPKQFVDELINSLKIDDIRNKSILKAKKKRVKKQIRNLKKWIKNYDLCLNFELI